MIPPRQPPQDPPDPFDDSMFSEDLGDLFEAHRPYGRSETGFLGARSFRPAADVYESPEGLVISLDVPGLERDQVGLKLEGRHLTVSGSREFQREHPDEEFVRLERGFGSFRRVFEVPSDTDPDQISARLDQGVLTITVPRRKARRTIPVESDEGAG